MVCGADVGVVCGADGGVVCGADGGGRGDEVGLVFSCNHMCASSLVRKDYRT